MYEVYDRTYIYHTMYVIYYMIKYKKCLVKVVALQISKKINPLYVLPSA